MRWLVILALLAPPAMACEANLRSGEHAGFTRIVVEDAGLTSWQLRREGDRYVLRVSPSDVRFDLANVYKLIRRDRLADIRAGAEEGRLELDLGCLCHAEAEEIRPGVIVIDLADGPPAAESPFEETPTAAPAPKPPSYSYDWRAPAFAEPAPTLPLEDPALSLMRQSLLEQISRGAVAGTVEIADPLPDLPPATEAPSLPQVRVGEAAGFAPQATDRPPDQLTATGLQCIPDDRLAIDSWGKEGPVAESISVVSSSLTAELDRPDEEKIRAAVRYYLFLGFGAEAAQIMHSFDLADPERPLWDAMARILDGTQEDPEVLQGMEACDTAAALWAVLADPGSNTGARQIAAVLRSFSSLPIHLRRGLGPRLAQIFLDDGDPSTARAIRDAIARAPGPPGPQVEVMEAKLEIAEGDREAGERTLDAFASTPGPAEPEALLALAEQKIATGGDIAPDTVTALAALLRENSGAALEPRILTTYRRALAASGDSDAAFALPASDEDAVLWKILAEKGSDSSLLAHAVLGAEAPVPALPPETRTALARRLVGLGFADAAARWVDDRPDAAEADRLLAGEIALQQEDGRAALRALAGLTSEKAAALRGEAALRLGDPAAAETAFAEAGDQTGVLRAARRAEDWDRMARDGTGAWKDAADLLAPPDQQAATLPAGDMAEPDPPGPLALGRAALAESAATRNALAALLRDTPAASP